jgi:hypothetical protein
MEADGPGFDRFGKVKSFRFNYELFIQIPQEFSGTGGMVKQTIFTVLPDNMLAPLEPFRLTLKVAYTCGQESVGRKSAPGYAFTDFQTSSRGAISIPAVTRWNRIGRISLKRRCSCRERNG